jgi:hypothetical protein
VAVVLLAGLAAFAAGSARAAGTPRVSLSLTRTGYAYRWEYQLRVRVRPAASTGSSPNLRVVATGSMSAPGHQMSAGPVRLAKRGAVLYEAKLAFYMPGEWRISIGVSRSGAAPTKRASTSY